MNRYRKLLRIRHREEDPLSGVANLFDAAMVFVVALMVAIVVFFNMTDLLTEKDVTIIKNPSKKNMEIIVKKGKKIEKYKANGKKGEGKGRQIGIAYQLENGDIIYVPEQGNLKNE
jgi:hypothetical protein